MFCKNCGKEINDKATICIHCGCSTGNNNVDEEFTNVSKKTIGVLMGFFLGLIGLVIGICLYPSGSEARRSFVQGWGIAFAISIGLSILLYAIMFAGGACAYYMY